MQMMAPLCPIHSNGGAGHDNKFPLRIFIPLVNPALKVRDKPESDGRNGPVEIYVCGVLIEMGVRKVIMNRQTSFIFPTSAESAPYPKLVSFKSKTDWGLLTLAQDINLRRLGAPFGTIPITLNTSIQNNGYNLPKNFPNHSNTR